MKLVEMRMSSRLRGGGGVQSAVWLARGRRKAFSRHRKEKNPLIEHLGRGDLSD